MPRYKVISVSVKALADSQVSSRLLHLAQFRRSPTTPSNDRFKDPELYKLAYPALGTRSILDLEREPQAGEREPCLFKLTRFIDGHSPHQLAIGQIDMERIPRDGELTFSTIDSSDNQMYTFHVERINDEMSVAGEKCSPGGIIFIG